MAEIKTIYLFLSRVVDRQKDKMNGEVKMKFNIKSDVDTTRKEIESALKNNEQEKQETQSYLNKKKNNKVKWDRTKWIISIILLLAGIIFVGVNNGLAHSTVRTGHKKYEDAKVYYLKSDSKCTQEFKGYDGTLEDMSIYIDNQGRESSKGSMILTVVDKDGNELATTSKPLTGMKTRKYTHFTFEKPAKLKRNEYYTLIIQCEDAYNPQKFGVYTTDKNNSYLKSGTIDGQKLADGEKIAISMEFQFYNTGALRIMFGMLILSLIFVLVPFGVIEEKFNKKFNKNISLDKILSRILFWVSPIVAYFMVESLSSFTVGPILESLFTVRGLLNIIIYYIVLFVFFAITNKTQYSAILMCIAMFVLALTNYFVFGFRGIPVLAADVLSIGTALNVADSFEYTFDIYVLWAVSFLVAFSGAMFSLKSYKGLKLKKRLVSVAVIIAIVIGGYNFYINSSGVVNAGIIDSQWKPQLTYAQNGSVLSFTTSWKYIKNNKPDEYSTDDVEKIAKNFKSDSTDKNSAKTKKMPNVIAIMNESLADLNVDGPFETSEDYLPFIHSLTKNTIKGKLYVSIEGANTANSEFEFLTGNSLAFFAPRAVPYNNYVKGVVPSLTRTLVSQGYMGNNSYHPYKRSGWNRENVYNSLGFNHFYSMEYYKKPEFIRNFISDKTDMEQITKDYEKARSKSSDPFYLFNVTVQNHGGYVGNRGFVDTDIQVTNSMLSSDEVEQYVTLAKKSDEAFEELIKYFEKVDEPTIIVMFGDHQPPLSTDFYSNIFGKKIDNFTAKDTATWYSTPYVIWANYDIEEKQNEDMSANYLSSYLLNLIGADMTGYNKYLLDLQKKIPVLTGLFYQGDDGEFRNIDEKSKYTKYINEYSKVQYNGLFDKKHRLEDFFFLKDGDYQVKEDN